MKNLAAKKSAKASATGGSAAKLSLKLMLALLIVFAAVGVALYLLQLQGAKQRGMVQVETAAQGVASKLAAVVSIHSAILVRFAQNSELATALEAENWLDIRRQEKILKRLLPEADAARFFPFEWDQLNPKANPPVSYATLEMLRGVERTGKPSVAEVHQPGQAQPHIALAAPVINGKTGETAGVAQLVLPVQILKRAFESSSEYGGDIGLQQVVDSGRITLAESAPGKVDQGALDGEVDVPGTLWRLVYKGGSNARGSLDQMMTWGVLGVALVLSGLAVVLFSNGLGRALKRDGATMLSLLKALLSGGGERPPPLAAVPELQDVMNLLARPGVNLKAAAVEAPTKKREEMAAVASAVEKAQMGGEPDGSTATLTLTTVPEAIFRAYDIRGIVDESLFPDTVYQIGRAIGSMAGDQGEQTVIIGRDGRNSSESLAEALARGLSESGRDVVDIGLVPTPVLYFATHFLGSNSGVMVTGSHNAPEYNGLKTVLAGESLSADQIQDVYRRIVEDNLNSGQGTINRQDLVPDYINRITEDVQLLGSLKLVIDCGNGVASVVAPALFRALGCEVTDLYCEVNGDFPNHHPNPGDPENMRALIKKVREQGADLGVAFDGDGDRLGVVDSQGRIIWPDRLLMLLARDVLLRHPGADVIYDVKSSRNLAGEILTYGGRPIMWKSGHSLVKAKMRETGALLAAEMSGHIYFKDRWYGFDDGLYSCGRLLEVLSAEGLESADVFSQFPENVATPEFYAPTDEGENFKLMDALSSQGQFPGAKLVTIDGIRAEFEDGWGLARPSNTSPALVFRFEADGEAALARIQGLFREQFSAIAPDLQMPF
ncbi:MAG: phosphomannomutase/phosphoglucomutase [Gammaproteobacteria bacterium]|nr:phosphomannomutase/phosphoglucomutase [Gammaproteobacteria bacterium]